MNTTNSVHIVENVEEIKYVNTTEIVLVVKSVKVALYANTINDVHSVEIVIPKDI